MDIEEGDSIEGGFCWFDSGRWEWESWWEECRARLKLLRTSQEVYLSRLFAGATYREYDDILGSQG